MNRRNSFSYLGLLLAVVSLNSTATKSAHNTTSPRITDVCSVLNNPDLYLNKEISLRGSIFAGMDGTNIRDSKCSDKGVNLSVEKARYGQTDIVSFFQKMRVFGNHGCATIVGEFVKTKNLVHPYSVNIHRVSNVTRSSH